MINGHPAHIDELMALCNEHNLAMIEDCAQCYLAYYKGKVVGSFGDFASWSFQGSKHVTCGRPSESDRQIPLEFALVQVWSGSLVASAWMCGAGDGGILCSSNVEMATRAVSSTTVIP